MRAKNLGGFRRTPFPDPDLFLDGLPEFSLMPKVTAICLDHKTHGTEGTWRKYGSIIRMVENRPDGTLVLLGNWITHNTYVLLENGKFTIHSWESNKGL